MRRLTYALLAILVGVSLGAAVVRIDRLMTRLENAALASERAANETEETMRAARKAFITDK